MFYQNCTLKCSRIFTSFTMLYRAHWTLSDMILISPLAVCHQEPQHEHLMSVSRLFYWCLTLTEALKFDTGSGLMHVSSSNNLFQISRQRDYERYRSGICVHIFYVWHTFKIIYNRCTILIVAQFTEITIAI